MCNLLTKNWHTMTKLLTHGGDTPSFLYACMNEWSGNENYYQTCHHMNIAAQFTPWAAVSVFIIRSHRVQGWVNKGNAAPWSCSWPKILKTGVAWAGLLSWWMSHAVFHWSGCFFLTFSCRCFKTSMQKAALTVWPDKTNSLWTIHFWGDSRLFHLLDCHLASGSYA